MIDLVFQDGPHGSAHDRPLGSIETRSQIGNGDRFVDATLHDGEKMPIRDVATPAKCGSRMGSTAG